MPVLGGECIIIVIVWYFVWHRNPPQDPSTQVTTDAEDPDAPESEVEMGTTGEASASGTDDDNPSRKFSEHVKDF